MINDLEVDPYEWFDNPLDSMPIAREEASLPNVKPTFGGCYNYEKLKAEGLVSNTANCKDANAGLHSKGTWFLI